MYLLTLTLHSLLRWVVILTGLLATVQAVNAWLKQSPWTRSDERLGLIFVISLDLQVVVGFVLYLFLSPVTTSAIRNLGATMSDSTARFWTVEHLSVMFFALAVVHLARVRLRHIHDPVAKHRLAALRLAIALLLIAAGTPWPFTAQARPLLRMFGAG